MAAVGADGDRRSMLKKIKAPTLVIHGEHDPLAPLPGGRDTADNIAGARLKTIAGMGHDLPLALVDRLADAIAEHIDETTAIRSEEHTSEPQSLMCTSYAVLCLQKYTH